MTLIITNYCKLMVITDRMCNLALICVRNWIVGILACILAPRSYFYCEQKAQENRFKKVSLKTN